MKPLRVLVDVPVEPSVLADLQSSGRAVFDMIDPPAVAPRALPAEQVRDIDVLFCRQPPTNFAEAIALKWVQLGSAGYAQLFGLDLPARGIRASNASGCFDTSIGEWNVAMMINLARNTRQLIRHQETMVWDRSAEFQREIRGLTVGVWGYGGIGRETARLAKAMGLRVHVLTRDGRAGPRGDVYAVAGTGDPDGVLPDRVFGPNESIEFLGGLDFLVLAVPLTKVTEGMIGERELSALPRHAFVLNPARGQVIQEAALLRALRERWIAGAALDTHYHYPMPPEHPLWQFPNVIFTPHISGDNAGSGFKTRLWDIFAQNVDRFLAGKPLLNELSASRLAGG